MLRHLKKKLYDLIETLTKNGYIIKLIDLYLKIIYDLHMFIKNIKDSDITQ